MKGQPQQSLLSAIKVHLAANIQKRCRQHRATANNPNGSRLLNNEYPCAAVIGSLKIDRTGKTTDEGSQRNGRRTGRRRRSGERTAPAATCSDQRGKKYDGEVKEKTTPRHIAYQLTPTQRTPPRAGSIITCSVKCPQLSFSLHLHHRDLGKPFFEGRRLELGPHAAHHVFGHHPLPPLIPLQT